MLRISDAVPVAVVAAAGVAAAIIDLRTRRVPNRLTFGVAVLGLTLAALHWSKVSLAMAAAGLVVGLLLMLPGHVIGATGAGDVKLFAAAGTLLGPAGVLAAFVYTAIAGGIIAVVVALQRRRLSDTMQRTAALVATAGRNVGEIEHPSSNNRFAYAPAIAVGTVIAALGL